MEEGVESKEFAAEGDKDFGKTLKEAQSWRNKYNSADQIPDEELPDNYDFRNIDGYDFTNEVRDQGHCGSCYTVAFSQAVESRLKLKYGKKGSLNFISIDSELQLYE